MKISKKFLVRSWIIFSCIFAAGAFAQGEKNMTGVLQAYWLPQWTADGQAQTPHIMMRFFGTDSFAGKTLCLYESKNKQDIKDYFNQDQAEKFIRREFKSTPVGFFKYKEGHVEQAGKVVYSDRTVLKECDSEKSYVKLHSFTASSLKNYDIAKLESQSGCGSEPYTVLFTVKEGDGNIFLKAEPSDTSKNIGSQPVEQPLVKIKTVNDEWLFVSLYDASKPGGTFRYHWLC